jgi:hypothetical protein
LLGTLIELSAFTVIFSAPAGISILSKAIWVPLSECYKNYAGDFSTQTVQCPDGKVGSF